MTSRKTAEDSWKTTEIRGKKADDLAYENGKTLDQRFSTGVPRYTGVP